MGSPQQFCLKWNNHHSNMLNVFEHLLMTEALIDVTLACEGSTLKAHKMVLSACSPFFQSIFIENPCKHPVIILKDMRFTELRAIVDFMYRGEVNVSQEQLSTLLKTAETLKVKGLAEVTSQDSSIANNLLPNITDPHSHTVPPVPVTVTDSPPLHRRKRGRPRKRSLSGSNRSEDESHASKLKEPRPEIEVIKKKEGDDTNEKVQNPTTNHDYAQPVDTTPENHSGLPSIAPSTNNMEEPLSADEDADYSVEPQQLLEQTLTTDNVSVYSNNSSSSNLVSTSKPLPSETPPILDLAGHKSSSDSLALVHIGQEQSEDVKPMSLASYDESSLGPLSDHPLIPSLPGPSSFSSDVFLREPQQEGDGGWRCRVCHFQFTSKCALTRHMLIHYPERERYTCNICQKVISRKDHLRRHVRLRHLPRDQLHVCTLCSKPFVSKTYLGRHMKAQHGAQVVDPA